MTGAAVESVADFLVAALAYDLVADEEVEDEGGGGVAVEEGSEEVLCP